MNNHLGFDCWKSTRNLHDLCFILNNQNIIIYDFHIKDDAICFYTHIRFRKILMSIDGLSYLSTTGILGFVLRMYRDIFLYVQILIFFLVYYFVSNCIFQYEVKGEEGIVKDSIISILNAYSYPYYQLDLNNVIDSIYKNKSFQLSWLSVYKEGSRLIVDFSENKKVLIHEYTNMPLFATKDAVIASFDVQHGFKKVDVHQFVKMGTLLVDNVMYDSFNQPKDIYVKGTVYGYTWYTITSEIAIKSSIADSMAYFRLLLDCRNQVSENLNRDEKIIKETVLHYLQDEGKIRMKVHYTLLEDITIP